LQAIRQNGLGVYESFEQNTAGLLRRKRPAVQTWLWVYISCRQIGKVPNMIGASQTMCGVKYSGETDINANVVVGRTMNGIHQILDT